MDPRRFDLLVRSLATTGSRRRVLGGALAGALVPLTAVAAKHNPGPKPTACLAVGKRCAQSASARARPDHVRNPSKGKGKDHPPACSKCCSRFDAAGADGKARCACKPEGESCANPSQCCGGLCRNGQCTTCPGDLTACNGQCVDLQSNNQHCGDCATTCASGQRCIGGICVCDGTSCPTGCCDDHQTCQRGTRDQACGDGGTSCQICNECTTCDGTTCVNAAACCGDASVCQGGACVACSDGQRCQGGACVCDGQSCPDGCCDGTTCVAVVDQSDAQCGAGGQICRACAKPNSCGGGNPGTGGVCGCTKTTCRAAGKNCGSILDGCGGTLNCGTCQSPETCGGGDPGETNVCGCTKTSCTGKGCTESDGCGGTCGCPNGLTCLSNGSCVQPCTDTVNCVSGCLCFITANGDVCAVQTDLGACALSDPASCPQGQICDISGRCRSTAACAA